MMQESMSEKEKQKIYKAAINEWGEDAQITMVFEEMAELQKELCKYLRYRDREEEVSLVSITEEIADVENMLEQMKYLFDIAKDVEIDKNYKLKRTKDKLDEILN